MVTIVQNKRIEQVERELESKDRMIFDLTLSADNPEPEPSRPTEFIATTTSVSSDVTDEIKMVRLLY